jgi:hypothetical protein
VSSALSSRPRLAPLGRAAHPSTAVKQECGGATARRVLLPLLPPLASLKLGAGGSLPRRPLPVAVLYRSTPFSAPSPRRQRRAFWAALLIFNLEAFMYSNDVLNAWSTWKQRNEGFTEGQMVDINGRRQTIDAGQGQNTWSLCDMALRESTSSSRTNLYPE